MLVDGVVNFSSRLNNRGVFLFLKGYHKVVSMRHNIVEFRNLAFSAILCPASQIMIFIGGRSLQMLISQLSSAVFRRHVGGIIVLCYNSSILIVRRSAAFKRTVHRFKAYLNLILIGDTISLSDTFGLAHRGINQLVLFPLSGKNHVLRGHDHFALRIVYLVIVIGLPTGKHIPITGRSSITDSILTTAQIIHFISTRHVMDIIGSLSSTFIIGNSVARDLAIEVPGLCT